MRTQHRRIRRNFGKIIAAICRRPDATGVVPDVLLFGNNTINRITSETWPVYWSVIDDVSKGSRICPALLRGRVPNLQGG